MKWAGCSSLKEITLASVSISEKGASCLSLISHVFAHLNCFRVVVDAASVFFCRRIDIPVDCDHFVADRFSVIGICGHDTLICIPFQCFRLAVHCCDGTFPVFLSNFVNFHPQCYFSVLFCQPVHFCEPCFASLDLWMRPPCHVNKTPLPRATPPPPSHF